jgi:L-lactate utilization protein LutC
MKRNGKLALPIVLGVIAVLGLSMSLSPILNLAVKAQGQNQSSSPEMSQQVQQKLDELAQKFRGVVNSSGANLSLPQGGNLSERLQTLVDSAQFQNLSQQLSQQLSQLGINRSNIQNLQEEAGSDFSDLAQKLQNLTSSRGGGQ